MTDNMDQLRDSLPYQYAATIAKRLKLKEDEKAQQDASFEPKGITAAQVRCVFYKQITDTEIVLPVLEEAWTLYDEIKRVKALKEKKL